LAGLLLVVVAKGSFQITFVQAIILSGGVLVGGVWASTSFGLDFPAEKRSADLNRRVNAVKQICERHGWGVNDQQAVNALADTGQLHFDEADLELMVQQEGEVEREFGAMAMSQLTEEGKPDFDRGCARRIVNLANVFTGMEGFRSVVATFEEDYVDGLPDLDHEALRCMRLLADGLVRQWGLERLYAP
jgi:hypothetical protein